VQQVIDRIFLSKAFSQSFFWNEASGKRKGVGVDAGGMGFVQQASPQV
jgi:hypothetical protein